MYHTFHKFVTKLRKAVVVYLSVVSFCTIITFTDSYQRRNAAQLKSIQNSEDEKTSKEHVRTEATIPKRIKINDEPEFNTELSRPVEEPIEETLTEEITSAPKGAAKKKEKSRSQQKEEDTVGYSFLHQKSTETVKSLNTSKIKNNAYTYNVDTSLENDEDEIGFSFVPIKQKNRRYKSKAPLEKKTTVEIVNIPTVEQSFKTRRDFSKPSIIDHYNKTKTSVSTNIPNNIEPDLENQRLESKKSKLVTPKVSYANILIHNIEKSIDSCNEISSANRVTYNECQATCTSESHLLCKTSSKDELNTSISNSCELQSNVRVNKESDFDIHQLKILDSFVENKSEICKDSTYGNIDTAIDTENYKVAKSLVENTKVVPCVISKSNSGSIEIIPEVCEESNFLQTPYITEESNQIEVETIPFEVIEENINNAVSLESSFDQFDVILSGLGNSERFFVDNQTCEDISTKVDKSNIFLNNDNYFQNIEIINTVAKVTNLNQVEEQTTGDSLIKNEIRYNVVDKCIDLNRELLNPEFKVLEELAVEQVLLQTADSNHVVRNSTDIFQGNNAVCYNNPTANDLDSPYILEPIKKNSTDASAEPSTLNLNSRTVETNMTFKQVRVLTLNNQEHQECTLYRIQKDWTIQFRLGPSLFGRKVYLYCNYPENNEKFNRKQYRMLIWTLDKGCKNADDTAAYTQIIAQLAGSFHFYFTFDDRENAEREGSGFFLVDPILKYGNNEELPLDCIQCQTVLAKNLGSFSSWRKKLRVAKESGYNMIHFSPIQELGVSNSCYSISEQMELNPIFKKENGEMPSFQEIKQFMANIRREWKVTSICDIVLNHTANESEWIKKHSEVTYNCINCPYMRPAYLLDAAFHQFSMDVKRGLYEDKGIPTEITSEDHLNAIRHHFNNNVLEPLKLQELYICDVNKLVAQFLSSARTTTPVTPDFRNKMMELQLIQDPQYRRLNSIVDMKLAQKIYNVYWNDTFDEESRLKKCAEEFKSKLDSLNGAVVLRINDHLSAAVENVIAGIRYFRVQPDGPKLRDITIEHPLVYRYFTDYGSPKSLKEHEEIMYSNNGQFLMAHNGWVMNSDPLKNFAAPDSVVYVRRELIAWGDSVKLRYGDSPEDCPFLWEYMRKYVEQTAIIFDGVRLDNCHSTPIPVAEYLLDCARKVKPDLYVIAELFTNSDLTDNIFVNRLGITSLIREAMSAWDSHEEGRLVYRYGGYPVGSFHQPSIRPLVPSIAHALFLDLTHDNPSPINKRSVFDFLPSTALVNMACCASGSNRGYDELVPHHIHVVNETRQYTEWTDDENLAMGNARYVTKKTGIIAAKKALNDLHFTLGKEGFDQVYVDQMDPDIVAVTRHCPESHHSYVLVAFTAFGHPDENAGNHQRGIKPLRVEGILEEIVLEATLSHVNHEVGGSKFTKFKLEQFVEDPKWICGLSEYQVNLKQHIDAKDSDLLEKVYSGTPNVTQLNFKNFKPGSVVVIKVSLPEIMDKSVKNIRTLIGSISKNKGLVDIIGKLTLADLNRVLYRCDQEERDEGFGFDTYHIPNFESTVYAGLQGFISLLANIRPNNDLGHPMCANLRDGNWMIEYIWKRLKLDEGTKDLALWIEKNTSWFNDIPRYLVPCYFDSIVTGIYIVLIEHCYELMSTFVNCGSTFVRGLSLGSVQFGAYIKSADLPVLSPNITPPKPPHRKNEKGEIIQACVTLAAGLPHFSVGYMRNWGRDTFIALRGLFIITGRYEEARQHILGYGACLRHGLIPNLLDGGRNPRFNCRDAVWWWLYCIKCYAEEAPNGLNILNDKVSRIFPTDDSIAQPPGAVDQPLNEVMQEVLTVHFQGLTFQERNAGHEIDAHMTDKGFNNRIGIHPETGFVFGGNEWNCGTWMDKMGSSEKAGNRGKPATPRDGSAVELIGLSKAVITWLAKINEEKKYPYSGVQRTHKNGSITNWSFKEWSNKIQTNFEKYFWINTYPVPNEIKPNLINKRGIYKDCYGATQDWTDFQLRCNFPIAMIVAPELFTPQQAWSALNQAEAHLVGPLGMKTLDPDDWAYRGDYDNSNDSDDQSIAHGFNYHQGPEWVWPLGYFLRAKLHFSKANGALEETLASTKLTLSKHFVELQTSLWRGLPELTNSDGLYCRDSSRTQAWSMSCILEVLHDLQKIESKQDMLN